MNDVREMAGVSDDLSGRDTSLAPLFPSKASTPGPTLAERIARARGGPGAKRDHGIDALRRVTGGVPCGDDLLCEGTETRAFCVRVPGDEFRIKAIPVPDDIKALCT